MSWLYYVFLLTHFGVTPSLSMLVGGGTFEGAAGSGGSLLMQLIQGASGLYAVARIATSPPTMALFKTSRLILLFSAITMVSALWSVDPYLTVRRSANLTMSLLLGIAMVGEFGARDAINLVIRIMVLACIMSVLVVIVDPQLGIHQQTDSFQNVHAGLWRGLLGHKVSLGMFAGVTIALLMFFGARSCQNAMYWTIGIASAVACLIGSNSATGMVATTLIAGMLYLGSFLASSSQQLRQRLLKLINFGLVVFVLLVFTGHLDRFATLLGRSADLTGRSTYWPHIEGFMRASFGYYIGLGYGAGFTVVGPVIRESAGMQLTEAHNGILELVVGLGHVGMFFVMGFYGWFLLRASRIVSEIQGNASKAAYFPYAVLCALLIISYAESIILTFSGMWSVLFALALAVLHDHEMETEESEARDQLHVDEEVGGGAPILRTTRYLE